jgi:hypothetical protein
MRSSFIFVTIVTCLIARGPSDAQESPAPNSLSPDKKWEYVGGENPKLVKAGTNDVAIDFLEQCDLGAAGEGSRCFGRPTQGGLYSIARRRQRALTLSITPPR